MGIHCFQQGGKARVYSVFLTIYQLKVFQMEVLQ
jgi:hypothetical protein